MADVSVVGKETNGDLSPVSPEQRGGKRASRKPPVSTDAQRAAGRAKLAERRRNNPYRKDFLDSDEWERMAHERGLRLPQWHIGPTPGRIQVWLRKLGISRTAFLEWGNFRSFGDFAALNPDWPMRALVGLLLEQLDANGGRL